MTEIYPIPYRTMSNLHEDEVTIIIRNQEFNQVAHRDGKTEIPFENCYFNKVTIVNTDEVNFEDVLVGFFGCYLGNMEVEDIVTSNISIGVYGSIISGALRSDKLQSVEFNNCLLKNSLFLVKLQKLRIAYTKENIQLTRWKQLLKPLAALRYSDLINNKQSYYVSSCGKLEYSSNFSAKAKKNLNLNLHLEYNKDVSDITTIVSNAQLESLSLTGGCQGKIEIESCKINNLYLYTFLPKESVSFYDIEPISQSGNSKIGIHKCNLEDVSFDNVYFDKYPSVSLYRTKLSETLFTSCNFPETYSAFNNFQPIENVHYPQNRTKNAAKDLYEMLLQLKKALESTGNYYEGQKMQAFAHEALREVSRIPRSDRSILWINSRSNNHGLSISLPLKGLLLFSIPLYILYLFSIGRIFINTKIDYDLIGYYFSFIDLTHRTDFLADKKDLNGWALAIDYLTKLIVGFFIYQFIAAFRKYGKK